MQYGAAGAAIAGKQLTVTQTTSKAILDWANFNIASGYTVKFLQPSSTAAILNNIWSADPSVIAGNLTANGQVYLYNQNGIAFTGHAQVNVGGLLATSLALPATLFENGILSQNAAGQAPPPVLVAPPNGAPGPVSVGPTAALTAADGGRIILLGSAVTNAGSISAPDGQAILGAANTGVYLAASTSPSLRGLLIEVNDAGLAGTVTNSGEISTPRGNITLAGLVVNQQGMLSATTSVNANGSIYLVGGDTNGAGSYYIENPRDQSGSPTAFGGLVPSNGGEVFLAPGSVTSVLPDVTDTGTLTTPQLANFSPSEIDIAAKNIAFQGNALVRAAGGAVNLYAAASPYQLILQPTQPVADGGTIYLDKGSEIDVSGLQAVPVSVAQNILQVTLETNDLQNDPLLRNGFLHGATVTVDTASPPSLFDLTPYENNIGYGISQILTRAGYINLDATASVIARSGSSLDVAGGSVAYQGAYAASTTNLLAANGKVYNISNAPGNIPYVAIANGYSHTDPTWGTSTSDSSKTYYPGYTLGANAGQISIAAPAVYLRGSLDAQTVDGPYQRTPATMAGGGTLVLGCSQCAGTNGYPDLGLDGGVTFADSAADDIAGNIVVDGYVTSAINLPAVNTVALPGLIQNGFNRIEVSSNGQILLPQGINPTLAANGSLALKSGQSIVLDGNVTIPGGSVNLQTVANGDELPHDIVIGPGATIDVSGNWTNDSPLFNPSLALSPIDLNGGSVTATAAGNVIVANQAAINVSGGAWLNDAGALAEGTAGSISLGAVFSLNPKTAAADPYTGAVEIASGVEFRGASLKAGGGGTLSLQSGSITVGPTPAGTPGELVVPASAFSQGGFSAYALTGENDVFVGNVSDTNDSTPLRVAPLQDNLVFSASPALQPSAGNLSGFTQLQLLPLQQRGPASLSLATTASDISGATTGNITVAADASITTDPKGSVSLAANGYNGNISVLGSITAPAGTITLQLENPRNPLQTATDPGFLAGQEIYLGPNATLAAPGYAEIVTDNPEAYPEGVVLGGGTISLLANKGFVQTSLGSLISANGAAGSIDVVNTSGVTPTTVAASGGTINLEAREGMVLLGNLQAQAAGYNGAPVAGAAGGALNIALGLGYSDSGSTGTGVQNQTASGVYPTDTRTLTVVGPTSAGLPALPVSNQLQSGTAQIGIGTIEGGGFNTVSLSSADTLAFAGNVALHATAGLTLDAPAFVAAHGAAVELAAPYVAIGNYANNADYFDPGSASPNASAVLSPVAGNATLGINAQLIDVRGISGWSGFSQETLASTGDIRFVAGETPINAPPAVGVPGTPEFEGALNTSAALTLQAAQVYPTTATSFAVNDAPLAASGQGSATPSTITVQGSTPNAAGAPPPPLSAGGSLTLNATTIAQDGVIRAPLGEIALNGISIVDGSGAVQVAGGVTLGTGSLTSVSADGTLIPYGAISNGTQWSYTSAPGYTQIITQPPAKQIALNGADVTVASGAKLDLSGGGELYAFEFIAGQGGAVDVLSPANLPASAHPAGTTVFSYAIVPGLSSQFAPWDAQYNQGSPAVSGETISLSGVPGLPAGTYALLPAYYALLPGAFAISVVQPNSGVAAGNAVQVSGGYLAAARFGIAGTAERSGLTSTVLVAPDSAVRADAQYTDTYANNFFSSAAAATGSVAPQLPADAGQLVLSASNQLSLNGAINFTPGSYVSGTTASGAAITQQGRGGDAAILGQNIVVVDPSAPASGSVPGTISLNVEQLDNLGAQTILIGASAELTSAGEQLNVGGTQSVELRNTVPLTAPQVILAAQDSITIDAGAKLASTGAAGSPATDPAQSTLLLPGGGALLRVSAGAQTALDVDPATLPGTPAGTVTIAQGASVSASGSLLLYGTVNTTLVPGAQVAAPAVALYSSEVSLGDVPAGTPGLSLTQQLLGSLTGLTDLTIGSNSSINFYGPVQLGGAGSSSTPLNSITLDSESLQGYGSGDKVLQAGTVTLVNSTGTAGPVSSAADGSGVLQIVASATSGNASTSGKIVLGAGDKTAAGFSSIDLDAGSVVEGQGAGSLAVTSAAPVSIMASRITGASGSTQSIATAGQITVGGTGSPSHAVGANAGNGAALTLQGGAIAQNGVISLPGGDLTLTATSGDVVLGSASVSDVAGTQKSYTVASAVSAGGSVSLVSRAGNVDVSAGAIIDVSGASAAGGTVNGDAGSLSVSAPQGTFSYAGAVLRGSAAAGQTQGSFSLDEGSGLAGSGLSALLADLASSGFTGNVDLRTRNDPAVVLGTAVTAGSFQLSVDSGSIEVTGSGVVNTSGGTRLDTDGGTIALWSATDLTIDPGAELLANAGAAGPVGANGQQLASHGGDITLGSANGQISIAGGTAQAPTVFSLSGGGAADTDGILTLRAPRTADDQGVQIQTQNTAGIEYNTRKPVIIEGVRTYQASSLGSQDNACGSGGSCDVADQGGVIFTDAQGFAGQASQIAASLGLSGAEVRPGIEVDSTGDLVVAPGTAWDLASWNAALGAPVNLTLRAAGNLIVSTSISDGFSSNGRSPATWLLGEPAGATQDSASYRLVAGADLTAANPLAVIPQPLSQASVGAPPNSGNFVLEPGYLIRTGTGNIDVATGGDVLLGYSAGDAQGNLYENGTLQVAESDPLTSAIYTAGIPALLTAAQGALFTTPVLQRSSAGTPVASYATDGGNITITAAGDVRSAPSAQLISDWLWRRGVSTATPAATTSTALNTTWWLMFSNFQQGVGALGGGDLDVLAGRDIVNLSAVIPTTGRMLAAAGATPTLSDLLVNGGGNLQVHAGGSIVSGVFEDDWGNALLTAGNGLTSGPDSTFGQETAALNLQSVTTSLPSPTTQIYPILVTGNGSFEVDARTDLSIEAVVTSTTLPLVNANQRLGNAPAFYTYAPSADPGQLALTSVGGDVTLNADTITDIPLVALSSSAIGYQFSQSPNNYASVYPSTLSVAALSGSVDLGSAKLSEQNANGVSITLFPASQGNLSILAAQSVNNDGQPYSIAVSQSDPAQVPTVLTPAGILAFPGPSGPDPAVPLHQGDSQPIVIVAGTGDIGSGSMTLPKAADILAGGNIADLSYGGSNLAPGDVTLIAAGGNISFQTPTAPVTNALLINDEAIQLAGPGYLEVLAGGSINLGDSLGIITSGNLSDPRLPTNGASIVVGAGFGTGSAGGLRQPDYQAFINKYLVPGQGGGQPAYANTLVGYMEQLDPAAASSDTYASALAAFEGLPRAQQLPLMAQVLSDELSATGIAHNTQGTSYDRGYTAISTLFPATDAQGGTLAYQGDLNMFYSQIKTEEGGDIDLLVPGGSVVVGVANPPASLSVVKQTTTSTGLVVPAAVDLGVLVLGDGAVQGFANQDFTVNQSRILTLEGGNIILWASNGSIDAGKGAKSASGAPPPVIDTDASGNLFVNPSNSVSGSGIGQLTTPGHVAGLVNLIAPKGDVNAGDAGIRVAGNLNIAAVQVIGAGNITVVGTSTGVPTSEAGAFAGALSGANSIGDAGKSAVEQLGQDLSNAAGLQQLTDSLVPSFIVVKMFCLGIDCESNQ